jgi:hypothetical protein
MRGGRSHDPPGFRYTPSGLRWLAAGICHGFPEGGLREYANPPYAGSVKVRSAYPTWLNRGRDNGAYLGGRGLPPLSGRWITQAPSAGFRTSTRPIFPAYRVTALCRLKMNNTNPLQKRRKDANHYWQHNEQCQYHQYPEFAIR